MQKNDVVLSGSLAGLSGMLIMIAQRIFDKDPNLDLIVSAIPLCVILLSKSLVYFFRVFKLPTYKDAVAVPKIDAYIKSLHAAMEDKHLLEEDKSKIQVELRDAYQSKFKILND